jgi:hypothetical protein
MALMVSPQPFAIFPKTLGKRHKALAAKNNMGMLETRAGQAEMIEPVIEWRARDGDAKASHIGEVRKPKPARRCV